MSHFDDNKYRFRLKPKQVFRTEAYPRRDALKKITEWLASGIRIGTITYCQRKISLQHREALFECAQLWTDLDHRETQVKERNGTPKQISN